MSQTYAFYDTITGAFLDWAQPSTFSYSRSLNASGTGQATFTAGAVSINLLTPWAVSLMAIRNGVPVGGGLIVKVAAGVSTMTWTVSFADVRAILGRRTTFGSNGYGATVNDKLDLAGFTLQSMPAWLVWSGTQGPTANFAIPIFLPEGRITQALITSLPHIGSDTRTYYDYEVHFVDQSIAELQDSGLEVDFEPRLSSSNALEWLLRSAVSLSGVNVDFNMTTEDHGLFDVRYVSDGAKQSNVLYSIGKGSELDMRVTTARAEPNGPALERAENYKDIDNLAVLQNHSNQDLSLLNKSTIQWAVSMLATNSKGIENMRLGSSFNLYFAGHPMVPTGWHHMRLIGYSGGESEKITLQLQPSGA